MAIDRDAGRMSPARSKTQSPQLQLLPQHQQHQHQQPRQANSVPQLIQDLLTHDPVQTSCRDRDHSRPQQSPATSTPSDHPNTIPSPNATAVPTATSTAQRHACEPCRVAKAKCEPLADTAPSPSAPCKRCAKTDRECVFAERSKTRRRKRRESSSGLLGGTDQRVEELERRIENLVAVGLANGIGGFEAIATGSKKEAGEKVKVVGEQRSRIEDVLNSPLERTEGCVGATGRDLYSGPPAQKRSRLGSEAGTVNGHTGQHTSSAASLGKHMFGQQSAPPAAARTAYTPVSPTTSSYQPRYQKSPTQPPYDPARSSAHEIPSRTRMPPSSTYKDVIDQGYISLSLATTLYNHFTVELLPHTPFIVLPPFFTTSACRESRPTLFLAILVGTLQRPPSALAESVTNDANGNALIDELHWMLAEKIMYRGEKSLEIIQALLVACSWYTTPVESGTVGWIEKHKGFMWITQAISMALELGLARPGSGLRSPPSSSIAAQSVGGAHKPTSSSLPSPGQQMDEIEGRRAALGCYWMSVNVCMVVKRPHLMKWSSPLNDALEVLQKGSESGNDGKATDKVLVEMVRAARIVEESGFTGCYETFHEMMGNGPLKIARVKFIITALERQVEDWWGKVPEAAKYHNSISLTYYALQIYIHEICLHSENCPPGGLGGSHNNAHHSQYGPDGTFKAPFLSDHVLKNKFGRFFGWGSLPTLSPALTSSYLPVIIKSAHNLLDTFLALGKGTIDFLPHVAFGRVCYAILVLVKIDRLFNAGNDGKAGTETMAEELKLGYYLERVLLAFGKDLTKVRGGGVCAGPKTCLGRLFQNMKNWWDRQVKMADCAGPGEGGECGRMRNLFNCGSGSGGAAATGTPAATESGIPAHYMTPSSSASDQPTPGASGSGVMPSFTPVNGYSNQQSEQIAAAPESFVGMQGGITLVPNQEEFISLGLGGWSFTDEDWIALMNAGGSGLQLFDY